MPCDNVCDGPLNGGPLGGGNCQASPLPFSGGGPSPLCFCQTAAGSCVPGGTGSITGGGTNYLCLCLSAETEAPLYQRDPKKVADIAVGDKLVSAEGCPEIVTAVLQGIQPLVRILWDGGDVTVSRSHHFLAADGAEVVAENLTIGDRILGADSAPREVTAIEPQGEGAVVSITCQPTHVFQAAGLLHHNKSQITNYPQAML